MSAAASNTFRSIHRRLTYGTVALSLVPLVLAGAGITYYALRSSREALQARAFEQMRTTGEIKKTELIAYFDSLEDNLSILVDIPGMVDLSRTLASDYKQISQTSKTPIAQSRLELTEWYDNAFKPVYDKRNPGAPFNTTAAILSLSDNATALQHLYLAKNPNQDDREDLFNANDGSAYSSTHEKLHDLMLESLEHLNFEGVNLVDPITGEVFYTTEKEINLGVSLVNGSLKDSPMGQAFRGALSINEDGKAYLTNHGPYFPDYGNDLAFMALPIRGAAEAEKEEEDGAIYTEKTDDEDARSLRESGEILAVLIAEFPIDELNKLMTYDGQWKNVGLGVSGETYLVDNKDSTSRSISRFMKESPNAYFSSLASANIAAPIIDTIRAKGTNVGTLPVTTLGSKEAASGKTGVGIFPDYRSVSVLSYYTPAQVLNQRWSLLAQIDESEAFSSIENLQRQLVIAASAMLALLGFFAILFSRRLSASINTPIKRIAETVQKIASGDSQARTNLSPTDEIGTLGTAFDTLLDERIAAQLAIEHENNSLNNSVIEIMTSVAQLAQRDLNVKVPVSENVTGAVSDAINMMTNSTASALKQVNVISAQVSESSNKVKQRADNVLRLADEASNQANAASAELSTTASALRQIGEQAQGAGREAERALVTTNEAMAVVRATVEGITNSRDQIRETEKRVKRLAERSQEISSVVTIIGQIAERTSVLALNASMQAVAAGDAGRGFAVVADEVKRLAENAREATQQIAGLVRAVQSDTTETLQAMNGTIAQVVDITRLADRAGVQMSDNREATEALVNSVRSISVATQTQGEASQRLLTRAYELIGASQNTLQEIELQRGDTEALTESASALVRTVSEFRLPG